MSPPTRCGLVAVLGPPNAGKSTLVNHLVGTKVSIVSRKVQTTRTRVTGIAIQDNAQIVFIDTPGLFAPEKRLERAMVAAAWEGGRDSDIVLFLLDAARRGVLEESEPLVRTLSKTRAPCFLVLNKVDLVPKEKLFALSAALNAQGRFDSTFMISALSGSGTQDLLRHVIAALPESPFLYPEDHISDMPMRLLAAEITREKIFDQLHQEIPYAVTVETEDWQESESGDIHIAQVIYAAKSSHKPILLGKGGQRIKALGQAARTEMAALFECPVHLKLFVKVQENWADDPERYQVWGLDFKA